MGAFQSITVFDSVSEPDLTDPMHQTVTDIAASCDAEAIETLLRTETRVSQWPEEVAQLYHEDGIRRIFSEHRFLFLLGFMVSLSTISCDMLIGQAIAWEGAFLRAVTTVPLTLLGLIAGARGWRAGLAFMLAASPVAFVAVLSHLSLHLSPAGATQYLFGAALVVGVGNIILPLRLHELALFNCAAIAAAVLGAGLGIHGGGDWGALLERANDFVVITLVATATLPLAARIARLRRTNFLLNLRMRIVSAQLVEANRNLRRLSETDPLTGVANRRRFEELFDTQVLAEAEGKGEGRVIGLMMIDLDHFKPFNDCHGHQAGDSCLIMVAGTLEEVFAEAGGIFARYGGEEFIAALHADDAKAVMDLAEQARRAVAGTLAPVSQGGRVLITASVGVAIAPVVADLPREELIEMADAALYAGKDGGRNRVEVVEAEAAIVRATQLKA